MPLAQLTSDLDDSLIHLHRLFHLASAPVQVCHPEISVCNRWMCVAKYLATDVDALVEALQRFVEAAERVVHSSQLRVPGTGRWMFVSQDTKPNGLSELVVYECLLYPSHLLENVCQSAETDRHI